MYLSEISRLHGCYRLLVNALGNINKYRRVKACMFASILPAASLRPAVASLGWLG